MKTFSGDNERQNRIISPDKNHHNNNGNNNSSGHHDSSHHSNQNNEDSFNHNNNLNDNSEYFRIRQEKQQVQYDQLRIAYRPLLPNDIYRQYYGKYIVPPQKTLRF